MRGSYDDMRMGGGGHRGDDGEVEVCGKGGGAGWIRAYEMGSSC